MPNADLRQSGDGVGKARNQGVDLPAAPDKLNFIGAGVAQTTGAGARALTVPSPTDATAGSEFRICNTGTAAFTVAAVAGGGPTITVAIQRGVTLIWDGTTWQMWS